MLQLDALGVAPSIESSSSDLVQHLILQLFNLLLAFRDLGGVAFSASGKLKGGLLTTFGEQGVQVLFDPVAESFEIGWNQRLAVSTNDNGISSCLGGEAEKHEVSNNVFVSRS